MGRGKGVSACEQDNSQTQTCADHGLGKVDWLQNDSHPEERGCIMHASSDCYSAEPQSTEREK